MSEAFTFFFTEASPFSQWHRCRFEEGGVAFTCAEQYMMHGKALLFGDRETAAAILAADHPRTHKELGRKVTPFVPATWEAAREGIVLAGNRAKFTQNPALRALLLATAGTTLVEASPFDRIWGVGMGANNPLIHDRTKWRGKNLLGQILTRLRDELLAA